MSPYFSSRQIGIHPFLNFVPNHPLLNEDFLLESPLYGAASLTFGGIIGFCPTALVVDPPLLPISGNRVGAVPVARRC